MAVTGQQAEELEGPSGHGGLACAQRLRACARDASAPAGLGRGPGFCICSKSPGDTQAADTHPVSSKAMDGCEQGQRSRIPVNSPLCPPVCPAYTAQSLEATQSRGLPPARGGLLQLACGGLERNKRHRKQERRPWVLLARAPHPCPRRAHLPQKGTLQS